MDIQNQYQVSFTISDTDLAPAAISIMLDLKPNFEYTKGKQQPYRASGTIAKTNLWSISSPLPKSDPIEKHLKYLLNLLANKKELIHELSETGEIEFLISAHLYDPNFGFIIEKEIIYEIAEYNALLDFNYYFHHLDK